ncbi:MAG: septal ring lytic transglycosylase RlpA family protein [Candidatus Kapabacteria bacterium]|nr:septal ring lytic transglycosylase RlpA family protein [Candidatus Kapabacteria bacterium]
MTKQTSLIVRITVFVIVMLTVMSISFLVEAQDVPARPGQPTMVEQPVRPTTRPMDLIDIADGLASWYGATFHGRRTASGRRYNMHEMTAAHRNLPFGSLVRVVNATTGQRILVEITDRGPFIRKRVIDLSRAAAKALGVSVTPVELQAMRPGDFAAAYAGDSSAVVIIDADHEFHTAHQDVIDLLSEPMAFTKAITSVTAGQVIAVVPSDDGQGFAYALARVRIPVEQLDTIDVARVN